MKESDLRTIIGREFGSVTQPEPDRITTTPCACGCTEKALVAFNQLVQNTSLKCFEEICDHLWFLSPEAYDFIFPQLMVAALDGPDNYFVPMTVFHHLTDTPEHMTRHFSHYSLEQRRALYAYLKFTIEGGWDTTITQRHLNSRLAFWDKFTEPFGE